jgi:hypothetical protein
LPAVNFLGAFVFSGIIDITCLMDGTASELEEDDG